MQHKSGRAAFTWMAGKVLSNEHILPTQYVRSLRISEGKLPSEKEESFVFDRTSDIWNSDKIYQAPPYSWTQNGSPYLSCLILSDSELSFSTLANLEIRENAICKYDFFLQSATGFERKFFFLANEKFKFINGIFCHINFCQSRKILLCYCCSGNKRKTKLNN